MSERKTYSLASLCVGYCRGTSVSGAFMESMLETMRTIGPFEYSRTVGGPLIAAARNEIVNRFLANPEREWLLMLDTDMSWTPGTLQRLMSVASEDRFPIIAGLAFSWNEEHDMALPVIYKLANPERPEMGFVKIKKWPKGTVLEGHTAGAACFMAHRSVLEKVRDFHGDKHYPWFREDVIGDQACGEDMVFWHRVITAGVVPAVDTCAVFDHAKTKLISEKDYDESKL